MYRLLTLPLVIPLSSSSSQVQQGSWELSLSGTMGSVVISREVTSPFGNFSTESEAMTFISTALRPGYYVLEGLAMEPEILWTAIKGANPSFILSGNVAYNLSIPEVPLVPFALIGYGKANGLPVPTPTRPPIIRATDELTINVLNIDFLRMDGRKGRSSIKDS